MVAASPSAPAAGTDLENAPPTPETSAASLEPDPSDSSDARQERASTALGTATIREYEPLDRERLGLDDLEWQGLVAFARRNQQDRHGNYRPVFGFDASGRQVRATNYVGILTTRRGRPIEILPKIDLSSGAAGAEDDEETRKVFLEMLRTWRGLRHAELPPSSIRSLKRFPMLEAFVFLFLHNLAHLARHGLARRYVPVEDNLPYLRGRLLFREQIRENLTNRARFFVAHDEFNANRPANRLIRSTLGRLRRSVRNDANRLLLRELSDAFSGVPPSTDPATDWRRHSVDRTMQHYKPVMAWVRLFLFGEGLATYRGEHENQSLLFPMEEIYEDFVTSSFRRHQTGYGVRAQGPQRKLTHDPEAFTMKPDITLQKGSENRFVLDAKWKRLKSRADDSRKRGISQADMYQLYAYGKRYECNTVALVYPRTDDFDEPLRFAFDDPASRRQPDQPRHDELTLLCLPFDVSKPRPSVERCVAALRCPERPAEAWNARGA